jgi:hypothetical protein
MPGCEQVTGAHLAGCPAANLDAAVRCVTGADNPPGSPDGSCCTVHGSHEDHAAHVAATGDATCRTVTITVLPGSVPVSLARPGG